MIRSIRLINWRSHADSKLEFRKGTNLLVGIMGAGKSAVLEGISFALFGTFPALERRKLKLDNVVRLNEPQARIILEFEWDGIPYRIERVIERSKKGVSSSAELFKNNALIEHGPTAVNSYAKSLTGVDYDLFTRAIYSEQNNIDYFLTLDPRRRKEEMDALLGLDRFELARANIIAVINRLRQKRETIEEGFKKEKMEEQEAREKAKSSDRADLAKSLDDSAAAYETKLKALAAHTSAFEDMKKRKDMYERLYRDEIRLSAQHDSLKKQLEGKMADEKSLEELEARLRSLQDERAKAYLSQRSLDEQNAKLSKEIGSLEERLKSAAEAENKRSKMSAELEGLMGEKSLEQISQELKTLEQTLHEAESEKNSIEREMIELSETLSKLRPGLSECPLCLSPLDDSGISHVREEKERIIKKKKARSEELAQQIAVKKKETNSLLLKTRRISILGEAIASLKKEEPAGLLEKRKEAETELSRVSQERKASAQKLDSLTQECEKLKADAASQKESIAKMKEASAIEKKLKEIRDELSKISFDEKAFEAIRKEAEASRLECERLLSMKNTITAQLKMADDLLKMIREELASSKEMEKAIKELYALEEQLSLYKGALLETQTSLRQSLIEAINTAMMEVWQIFYPYHNYRALRLGVSEKDYLFEVDDGGGWKGLETIASGGERACAALALRVALAMVLTPKLGWLILDEPTHNLDSEAVEMLSSALQFKVPQIVNQTFVITHDEAFMGSEFASSYRLSRDKEHNGETKAESM